MTQTQEVGNKVEKRRHKIGQEAEDMNCFGMIVID